MSRVPAPVRLAPIIRAPDREAKNDTQRRAPKKPMKTTEPVAPTEPMFTVYVNSSKCRHSGDLMNAIRDVHRIPCSVIDVAGGKNVPVWLRGTPSIVMGTDVYCGDTAFEFVASIGIGAEHESQDASLNDSPVGQPPCFSDILSGKGAKAKNEGIGCGLSQAFAAPVAISEEEAAKKYSGSVDDAMSRLMQSRGRI